MQDQDANNFEIVTVNHEVTIIKYMGERSNVQIPEKFNGLRVVGVKAQAFAGTGVRIIDFPDSLRALSVDALAGCEEIIELALPGRLDEIDGCLQDSCPQLKTVVLKGAALSPACMVAVSCLNGVHIRQQYVSAGIEAWIDLEMRSICG